MGVETGVIANGGLPRAVSGGDVSNEVAVQKRADIRLAPAPPGRYEVQVVERASFWRKQVLIQRFHRGQRKVVAREEAQACELRRGAGVLVCLVDDR